MPQVTAMMPEGRQRYYNNDGTPCAGGKLYTYAAGTTNPKTTYADADGTTPNPNPVPLDAHGEAVVYWSGAYKVDVKQADGQQVTGYPVDNLKTDPAGVWGLLASVLAMLAAATGATLLGFVQAGVGAVKRLIQDKLRESVSVLDFGAVGDGITDNTAAFDAATSTSALGPAGTRKPLRFPPGVYLTKKPLVAVDGDCFIGENAIIVKTTNTAAVLAAVQAPEQADGVLDGFNVDALLIMYHPANQFMQATCRGIHFMRSDNYADYGVTSTPAAWGLYAPRFRLSKIEDTTFRNCVNGMYSNGGFLSTFKRVLLIGSRVAGVSRSSVGWQVGDSGSGAQGTSTSLLFESCTAVDFPQPWKLYRTVYSEVVACAAEAVDTSSVGPAPIALVVSKSTLRVNNFGIENLKGKIFDIDSSYVGIDQIWNYNYAGTAINAFAKIFSITTNSRVSLRGTYVDNPQTGFISQGLVDATSRLELVDSYVPPDVIYTAGAVVPGTGYASFVGRTNTDANVAAGANAIFDIIEKDNYVGYNAATGAVTILVPGNYYVKASLTSQAQLPLSAGVILNGVTDVFSINTPQPATVVSAQGRDSVIRAFKAGDVLTLKVAASGYSAIRQAAFSEFRIFKVG